jgi:HlyD family secretion protein
MRLAKSALPVGILAVSLVYVLNSQEAPTFLTAPIERGRVVSIVKASGAVEAVATVDVSSQLSGRIGAVFVSFNDPVKAGQPIAQLDQEIYAARVNEADAALRVARAAASLEAAALDRAKVMAASAQTAKEISDEQSAAIRAKQEEIERDFQRKLQLARTGSGSERDLSQMRSQRETGAAEVRGSLAQIRMKIEAIAIANAEAAMARANLENAAAVVEQKEAALAQAKVDLDRTVIRAPINGMIIKRDVNPGQTVAVSLEAKTLFTIANDLREMEVHGKIDEADVGQLHIGQQVEFRVDAYPDRNFAGQILQIRKTPEITQNVVTYTAIVSAPNPELLLLPGMTAQLRILVNDTGEVLKIPGQALRFRPKGGLRDNGQAAADSAAKVWVIGADGNPQAVTVTIGASDDFGAALIEGPLSEGQALIIGAANTEKQRKYIGLRMGF